MPHDPGTVKLVGAGPGAAELGETPEVPLRKSHRLSTARFNLLFVGATLLANGRGRWLVLVASLKNMLKY